MAIAPLIAGILLLVLGRRIFWIYVGAVGFVIGFNIAKSYFPSGSDTMVLGAGVVLGGLGILGAIFFQKVAISSSGFLAGAYIANELNFRFSLLPSAQSWIAWLAGGLMGILLAFWLFELAMILLSSILGSLLITNSLDMSEQMRLIGLIGLTVFGLMIQGGVLKEKRYSDTKN